MKLAGRFLTVPRFIEMWIIKTIILLTLLLYASVRDLKTREVPDSVSGMLLILSLVDTDIARLPSMLLGILLVFLPQFISALINPSKALGGADIKLSSAAAFLLGAQMGLFALIIGLTLTVIVMPIIRRIRKLPKDQPFPLIPFLSIGIVVGYFI